MPVADLYRTIEEHVVLKGKLEFVKVLQNGLSNRLRSGERGRIFIAFVRESIKTLRRRNGLNNNYYNIVLKPISEMKSVERLYANA